MMLSFAKDSLKKSQNFHLYKKSFNYVSSLSKNFEQRIGGIESEELSARNVTDHSNHKIVSYKLNKQDVSMTNNSQYSHQQIINSWPTAESAHYRGSNSKEIGQCTIDMPLSSYVKTGLVDGHGKLLPKTMSHLNSIHLQMFHDSSENYSKSSNSFLNSITRINGNKQNDSPPFRVPSQNEYPMGNMTKPTFLSIGSTNNPFMMHSSGFHTSAPSPIFINTVNRVSVDGKIGGTSQKHNSLAENETSEADESHEFHDSRFDFTMPKKQSINTTGRFSEYLNNLENNYSERDFEPPQETSSPHRKRRNAKGKGQASPSSNNINEFGDTGGAKAQELDATTLQRLEKLYPDPRSTLNKLYSIVCAELKDASHYMPRGSFESVPGTKIGRHWRCTYKVSWPSEMSFSSTAKTKPTAANMAAHKCLYYLLVNDKMKNGLPTIYSTNEIKDILNKPIKIEVRRDLIYKVDQLLDWYRRDITHLISSKKAAMNDNGASEFDVVDSHEDIYEGGEFLSPINELITPSNNLIDPLRGTPLIQHDEMTLNKRDMDMYHNLRERKINAQNRLPIMDYREDIINQLEDERVLVVKGEPGCGKSTQLPQFILDYFTERGKGTACNIIITQPRRISAISLAKRVADERNERLGESVGYQVRLQNILPSGPSGGILFCSTGILLRRLQSNPSLIGCSHVILDEAHERDLNTDILIVLLNRALSKNPNLKLVIMSATMNAGLFERYFNCSTISIPGFTYAVKMHFLEDIVSLGVPGVTYQDMSLPNPSINAEQIAYLIRWISNTKPQGAILCFLPGWSEIQKLKRILEDILSYRSHVILPVHSRLPHSDQSLIFNRPPEGVRKIILATNIAETSITIDDVVYVVDSCAHKEVRLQHDTGHSSIDNQWVSQGNINQRKGRAGRVQPGESYHFITHAKYRSLDVYPIPEIMRAELQKAVLDCKIYTKEKAAEFFAQMPEAPRTSAVQFAVNELIDIGALTENEELTPLGKRIALFPIDPRLSKVMVYSAIFQCVNPIITLTSILSSEFEIFSERMYDKSPIRRLKQQFDPASDHLALAWIFEQWNAHNNVNQQYAQQFCREAQLQFGRMMVLRDLKNLYGQHLSQCRMLNNYEKWEDLKSPSNKYANHDELIRGVLLAGLGRILQKKDGEFKNGRFKTVRNVMSMQDGHRATLTPDSVNYNREKWSSPYLTYQRHVHSTERRTTLIRETSLVSPVTVLLFYPGEVETRTYMKRGVETENVMVTFQGKKNVKLVCDRETAKSLLDLRESLQNVVDYYIENQGLGREDQNFATIGSFKEQMVYLLNEMLTDSIKQSYGSVEYSSESEDEESL